MRNRSKNPGFFHRSSQLATIPAPYKLPNGPAWLGVPGSWTWHPGALSKCGLDPPGPTQGSLGVKGPRETPSRMAKSEVAVLGPRPTSLLPL